MNYKAIRADSITVLYGKLAVWMEWGWTPIGSMDTFKKGVDTDYVVVIRKPL